jgi:hypothetical protein
MASPVYGKQFIRFAETGLVPDADSLSQFRVVSINNTPATEPPTIEVTGAEPFFGVLQQDVPAVDPEKATTGQRLGTVATSGLLLVEASAANPPVQGTELQVDGDGVAVTAGAGLGTTVVTSGGTAQVRQMVTIGGVYMALVSFG